MNTNKFDVEDPGISPVWGVEMVWVVVKLRNTTHASTVRKIIVGSFYSKPNSRKKSELLDHISEVYHAMLAKHKDGTYFVLCADSNDLKLDGILNLSPALKQIVTLPTRLDAILDPVITDLAQFYCSPEVLEPLDCDEDMNGASSDHNMVNGHGESYQ